MVLSTETTVSDALTDFFADLPDKLYQKGEVTVD